MRIWLWSLLTGGIIAILVFFMTGKSGNKKTYKYTAHYSLRVQLIENAPETFSISNVMKVLEKRLELAFNHYELKKMDDSTLGISLFEIEDTLYPITLLTYVGSVQFREVYYITELFSMLQAAVNRMTETASAPVSKTTAPINRDTMTKAVKDLLYPIDSNKKTESVTTGPDALIQFSTTYSFSGSGSPIYPPEIGKTKLRDTAEIGKLFRTDQIKRLGPSDALLCFGVPAKARTKKETGENSLLPLYFIKTRGNPDKAIIDNEDISDAASGYNINGKPEIILRFNAYGTSKWARMTNENLDRAIAIIVDGQVVSAPTVITPIPDGVASISGNYTEQEASDLANIFKAGKFPVRLVILSTRTELQKIHKVVPKKLLFTIAAFIAFTLLGFFILKTLKPTGKMKI